MSRAAGPPARGGSGGVGSCRARLTLGSCGETEGLAARLAGAFVEAPRARLVLALAGELGAGKSTFARALLRALGVTGTIRSPTYTLLEPYELGGGEAACHVDLYRLADAEELEFTGFYDLLERCRLVVVEWPDRVPAVAALATLRISLEHAPGGAAGVRVCTLGSADAPWCGFVRSLGGDGASPPDG